jgi:putative flippase GtrA
MSLSPSSGGPPSRRSREQRAYRLVQVGGVATVVAVVGLVLSIAGVLGSGLWIAAAVVAVLCAILFRSTVKR